MLRKVILTSTSVVSHFGIGLAINKKLQDKYPEIFILKSTDNGYSKEEVIAQYAKIMGVSIAVALVSSTIAGVIVQGVDRVAFPNDFGPY